jgi:RNA polymerase sigma factor (sigma-70 family)
MAHGDEEFAEFVQACSPGLLRAAYLRTGDRHTAEDAAQTALARTYAAWSRVRRQDAFAYTRRVLVNHVTDRWRRRLREYATGTLPNRAATADIAEEVTLRQWLITALASLTGRERAVVIMRYYFDLPRLSAAEDAGSLAAWWFTRKGACWRLRLLPASGQDRRAGALIRSLRGELAAKQGIHVVQAVYEPETHAFAENLAHQQDGHIPARVPRPEHRADEGAGDPRPLRPPGQRHALPNRRPSHRRTHLLPHPPCPGEPPGRRADT